jgi:hypothetical protein
MKSNSRTNNQKSSKPRPAAKVAAQSAWVQWFAALPVGVMTCAAFSPALLNDFVNWDDDTILADYLIWGMDPFGYHFTNWLLHGAANSVLFYLVGRRILAAALSVNVEEEPSCSTPARLWRRSCLRSIRCA